MLHDFVPPSTTSIVLPVFSPRIARSARVYVFRSALGARYITLIYQDSWFVQYESGSEIIITTWTLKPSRICRSICYREYMLYGRW